MKKQLVDLHIHSFASDGTYSPKEIIGKVLEKNIDIIALTNHNNLSHTKEINALAKENNIKAISGVEIDTLMDNKTYHILGYGIDPDDCELNEFIVQTKSEMMSINRLLIERMSKDFDQIDIDEYDKYKYDRTRGGWESLNYLMDKGITSNLFQGFRYYNEYGLYVTSLDLPYPKLAIDIIHQAGGYAVLAHPGECYRGKEPSEEEFLELLGTMRAFGLDGVECHYPKHSKMITEVSAKYCRDNEMLITGGCDCHGDFLTGREIGKIEITRDMVSIDLLL